MRRNIKLTKNELANFISKFKSIPDLISWRLIPQSVLNIYHEQSRDTGVDAVKIEDGKIVELYQIKHHNGTKLTYNEIEQFINKKILAKKVLILKDCIIDKKIELLLTEKNIQLA